MGLPTGSPFLYLPRNFGGRQETFRACYETLRTDHRSVAGTTSELPTIQELAVH